MMVPLQTLCTLFSCMIIYLTYRTDAFQFAERGQHMCKPCTGPDCEEPVNPADCKYGIAKDLCGRIVCAKGPGMRCGGDNHIFGRCGDGLSCLKECERCVGCSSLTFECFNRLSITSCRPHTLYNAYAYRSSTAQDTYPQYA